MKDDPFLFFSFLFDLLLYDSLLHHLGYPSLMTLIADSVD